MRSQPYKLTNINQHADSLHINESLFQFDIAPSMMKLITFAQSSSNTVRKTRSNSVQFIDYHDVEDNTLIRGHGKKGSIADEVSDTISDIDLNALAKQAALEFEALTQQNDALYREKESIQAKYELIKQNGDVDDKELIKQLQSQIEMLQGQVSEYEEEEQLSVQRLLDLSNIGQTVNDGLKEQLNEHEHQQQAVFDPQIVDDDHEVVDAEMLSRELQDITAERDVLLSRIETHVDIETLETKKKGLKLECEELESQIMEYEELKALQEETTAQRNTYEHFNVDMVQSLNTTITNLERELATKTQQLKQEKDAHFETLDKYTKLRDQVDTARFDLKKARTSSADFEYRSGSRIEQLESEVIDLNDAFKDEEEKLEKSKSVIMTLRKENRELEEELSKLNDKMEENERQIGEEMMKIMHVLCRHSYEGKRRGVMEIGEELMNVAKDVKRCIEILEHQFKAETKCKINSIKNINTEMEQLRKVIKSQQMQLEETNYLVIQGSRK
eukprot:201592_1